MQWLLPRHLRLPILPTVRPSCERLGTLPSLFANAGIMLCSKYTRGRAYKGAIHQPELHWRCPSAVSALMRTVGLEPETLRFSSATAVAVTQDR